MKFYRKKELIIVVLVLVIISTFIISRLSFSLDIADNGINVKDQEELTYYLNVQYDSIDKNKNDELKSGYINVNEVLPDNLEFISFLDNNIVSSNNKTCTGEIQDNKNGLKYDPDTRNISFIVKNLSSGCTMKVGIRVKVNQKQANDIYTIASASLNDYVTLSNDQHLILNNSINKYNSNIKFVGNIPNNLEEYELDREYTENSNVNLEFLNITGYKIINFNTQDIAINNSQFTMLNNPVKVETTLERTNKNSVKYKLINKVPDNYIEPKTVNYSYGDTVYIDKLKEGDIISGYRFMGWKSDDVTIDEDKFYMPDNDVTLVGEFEPQSYQVCYQMKPDNKEKPYCESHYPNETIKLIDNDNNNNYLFLGWNKEDEFLMPDNDIYITSNWQLVNGLFTPNIEFINHDIDNNKLLEYFNINDEYSTGFKIINNKSYDIKDIIIKIDGASMINTDNYNICNSNNECSKTELIKLYDNYYIIDKIPAYSTFETINNTITTSFNEDNAGTKVKLEIKCIGAITDNDYYLEKEVNELLEFNVKAKLNICSNVSKKNDTIFQYHITGNPLNEEVYDSWITLEGNECKSIYLANGEYQVNEIIPQDWQLNEVTGDISLNNEKFNVEFNKTYNISFTNKLNAKGYYHSSGRISSKIKGGN